MGEDAICPEFIKKAQQLCSDYLGGAWSNNNNNGDVDDEDFCIKVICGGMSNKLYLCSLSDKVHTLNGEPRQVVLRMYGLILSDFSSIVKDSVLVALLAERNLGPRVYGIFNEGRLEEYIESYTLRTVDLHQPHISAAIARTMAKFHRLQLPLSKKPTWLFHTMNDMMEQALSGEPFPQKRPEHKTQIEKMVSHDFKAEIAFIGDILAEVESPLVFSHNDLQEGNILLTPAKYAKRSALDGGTQVDELCGQFQLTAIDFEYASYNYRGFDFANHFCEWCFDYSADSYPYFSYKLENYPSPEEQLAFFRAYLDESCGRELGGAERDLEAKHMVLEAEVFVLASHLLWGLWSLLSIKISEIDFGYVEYAAARLEGYFKHKDKLLKQKASGKTVKEM